jgi:hypothetical protein
LLDFIGSQPGLHFQVFRILDTADSVGRYKTDDALRMVKAVIQRAYPTCRCGGDMESFQT